MTAQLIEFPTPERSRFTEAWALREGQMKKRGEGVDKTKTLWDRAAKRCGGQDVLLSAFKRYLREEKEPTCGRPGLSVWLHQQRYDHWIESSSTDCLGGPERQRKASPEPIRSTVAGLLGEDWTRSYLDPCTFHDDGYITPATDYGKKKLIEKAAILKAAGVMGLRK